MSAEPAGGAFRVVVQSPGRAGFGVVAALDRICPLPAPDIAAALFRSPGCLFTRLGAEEAGRVAERLAEAGLDVAVEPEEQPFVAGRAELDLALELRDPSRMTALWREVIHTTGLDGRSARRLLVASPCMLLGGVSPASAQALAGRFEALDARLVAFDPARATYDAWFLADSPTLAHRQVEALRLSGRQPTRWAGAPCVEALTAAEASKLWEEWGRRGDLLRVVCRALSRFDLRLEAAPNLSPTATLLVELGIPERVIPTLLQRLPVVVASGLDTETARAHAARLEAAGARVTVEAQHLQRFALSLQQVARLDATRELLSIFGDVTAPELSGPPPHRIPGPFTAPAARWLQSELAAVGTTSKLIRLPLEP
jgi:hypothetical protein